MSDHDWIFKDHPSKFTRFMMSAKAEKVAIALAIISTLATLRDLIDPAATIAYLAAHRPAVAKGLAVALIFIGFMLRGYLPKIYGTVEVCVGLMIINDTPDMVSPTIPAVIPLLTGAYVGVRGLDNIAKGLNAERGVGRVFNFLFKNPGKEKSKSA
ncbi:hypothetical protein [Sinorhizobium meliloti]|uniref:hypothetical protein n=1 Tax=Rhizobium meliloti TaxID=382 RepID=UPI000406ABCE|nr:hypothetical protein [Sinorhizobium meliloti]